MKHFWLLMCTWNCEHAVFYGEQALTLSPKYWPTEAEADDAVAALMGCPL